MIPHGAKMSHFAVEKLWGLPCISHPARHQCSLQGPLKVSAFQLLPTSFWVEASLFFHFCTSLSIFHANTRPRENDPQRRKCKFSAFGNATPPTGPDINMSALEGRLARGGGMAREGEHSALWGSNYENQRPRRQVGSQFSAGLKHHETSRNMMDPATTFLEGPKLKGQFLSLESCKNVF